MMNLSFDGCHLFQDDSAPIYRTQGINEWFDEDENVVNHMFWSTQSLRIGISESRKVCFKIFSELRNVIGTI